MGKPVMDNYDSNVGIDGLRCAIVIQAIKDYKSACKHNNKKQKEELIDFFTSSWFNQLSDLDGNYIMKEIEKNEKKRKRVAKRNITTNRKI